MLLPRLTADWVAVTLSQDVSWAMPPQTRCRLTHLHARQWSFLSVVCARQSAATCTGMTTPPSPRVQVQVQVHVHVHVHVDVHVHVHVVSMGWITSLQLLPFASRSVESEPAVIASCCCQLLLPAAYSAEACYVSISISHQLAVM